MRQFFRLPRMRLADHIPFPTVCTRTRLVDWIRSKREARAVGGHEFQFLPITVHRRSSESGSCMFRPQSVIQSPEISNWSPAVSLSHPDVSLRPNSARAALVDWCKPGMTDVGPRRSLQVPWITDVGPRRSLQVPLCKLNPIGDVFAAAVGWGWNGAPQGPI